VQRRTTALRTLRSHTVRDAHTMGKLAQLRRNFALSQIQYFAGNNDHVVIFTLSLHACFLLTTLPFFPLCLSMTLRYSPFRNF